AVISARYEQEKQKDEDQKGYRAFRSIESQTQRIEWLASRRQLRKETDDEDQERQDQDRNHELQHRPRNLADKLPFQPLLKRIELFQFGEDFRQRAAFFANRRHRNEERREELLLGFHCRFPVVAFFHLRTPPSSPRPHGRGAAAGLLPAGSPPAQS